jgi:hypothetical protein
MSDALKVAHFTIAASVEQSARWKQAAELMGHLSIGTWLAEAADTFMEARTRASPGAAGAVPPIALSWRRSGRFPVVLENGEEIEVTGMVSPPFGIYHGHSGGPVDVGVKPYTLVYVPERRILATFRHVDKARALASELAPALLRGLTPPDPRGILERYRGEAM